MFKRQSLCLVALARITSGVVEMFTAALLGIALDVVLEAGPEKFFAE